MLRPKFPLPRLLATTLPANVAVAVSGLRGTIKRLFCVKVRRLPVIGSGVSVPFGFRFGRSPVAVPLPTLKLRLFSAECRG